MKRFLSGLCLTLISYFAFADTLQSSHVRPKIFEATFEVNSNGKLETLKAMIIEGRRASITVKTGAADGEGNLRIQSYLLPKFTNASADKGATYLLHTQVLQMTKGAWMLISEPLMDIQSAYPASFSIGNGMKTSTKVSIHEIPSNALVLTCAKFKGKSVSESELDAALLRLDTPSTNLMSTCCDKKCGDNSGDTLSCCWGALCCDGCGASCCI